VGGQKLRHIYSQIAIQQYWRCFDSIWVSPVHSSDALKLFELPLVPTR